MAESERTVNGSGYNAEYGLLGSIRQQKQPSSCSLERTGGSRKKSRKENSIARTGVKVEAMVYGDGAFKDPLVRFGSWLTPLSAQAIQMV